MNRLLVVGGGLVGSQAAAYARRRGMEALVFDCGKQGAGSAPAAGVFKRSWCQNLPEVQYRHGLATLDMLYGLRQVTVQTRLVVKPTQTELLFVSPTVIMEPSPIKDMVIALGDGWLQTTRERYEGIVYLAAGLWCKQFLPELDLTARYGSAFVFKRQCTDPRMEQVAPYRQAIAFERDAGLTHFSDGTALKTYNSSHDDATLERASTLFSLTGEATRLHGSRPYLASEAMLQRLGDGLFLATGTRKMGALLGAVWARQLIEQELLTEQVQR